MPTEKILLLLAGALTAVLLLFPLAVVLMRRSRQPAGQPLLQESFNKLEDLSRRMDDLGRIFIIPRTRGGLGETMLEQLLENWLPAAAWRRQYRFADGGQVDAVIRAGSFLVPVDAKFPLEQISSLLTGGNSESSDRKVPAAERKIFLRYAREISEKYIRPEEGTLHFALLYLPSEHLYYRCFVEDSSLAGDFLTYNVIPVSPSSLFLYLQTIAYGLKGLALPERAKELRSHIHRIKGETERLERQFSTAAHHLKNLQSSFDDTRTSLVRLSSTAQRLSDGESE